MLPIPSKQPNESSANPNYDDFSMKIVSMEDYPDHLISPMNYYKIFPNIWKNTKQEIDDCITVELFIAAGQSNMSGRGEKLESVELDMLHVDMPTLETNKISYFDPIRGWCVCNVDGSTHENVDILKKVGVGPATSFVHTYQSTVDAKTVVGLIPTAVGATYLEEWLPDAKTNSDDYSKMYFPNCPNLMSCALRSIFLAVMSLQFKSHQNLANNKPNIRCMIKGILWYQGCNDTTHSDGNSPDDNGGLSANIPKQVEHYDENVCKFLKHFQKNIQKILQYCSYLLSKDSEKSLIEFNNLVFGWERSDNTSGPLDIVIPHNPIFPIVSVAITATRPWMKYLSVIRQKQFDTYALMQFMSYDMVDAFGGWLQSDCVHLQSISAHLIGILLANHMLQLCKHKNVPPEPTGYQLINELNNVVYGVHNNQIWFVYHEAIFNQAQEKVDRFLNSLDHPTYKTLLSDVAVPGSNNVTSSPIPVGNSNQNKNAAVNYVSGEITFRSMISVLAMAFYSSSYYSSYGCLSDLNPDAHADLDSFSSIAWKFYDLGCGIGIPMAAAALGLSRLLSTHHNHFEKVPVNAKKLHVVGIDLLKSKLLEANVLIDAIFKLCLDDDKNDGDGDWNAYGKQTEGLLHNVCTDCQAFYGDFVHEGIVQQTWGRHDMCTPVDVLTLSIIYICATVYDKATMDKLQYYLEQVDKGCLIIVLDKLLITSTVENGIQCEQFAMISSCQVEVTWGTAHAYVYEKL